MRRRILHLLLAAALLAAQWLVFEHESRLDQHASGHVCEWCLTHAPLQAGGMPAALPLPLVDSVFLLSVAVLVTPAGAPLLAYGSRAPPPFLSV
jgi:hypothetical protein